jgi:hypothetical protein
MNSRQGQRDPSMGAAYAVGPDDRTRPLPDVPQSNVGAPLPHVLASEHNVTVVFLLQEVDPDWDGISVRVLTEDSFDEPIAIVRFARTSIHFLGPPNDEAFHGHPLAARGLEPYGAYEVLSSSWIHALERMNSVHPYHDRHRFLEGKRHFVLSFHDTTFECVARDYSVEVVRGDLRSVIASRCASL